MVLGKAEPVKGEDPDIYNTTPISKSQRTLRKRGQSYCKSQRTRKSAVHLLEMTGSHIHETTMWLLKQDLNNDIIDRHDNMVREISQDSISR